MRLIVVVEGQTEEGFVNGVLVPHLAGHEVFTAATIVGKVVAEKRGHGGRGGGHFKHWLADLRRILGGDRNKDLRVTTLFDLYGLPDDFPGLDESRSDPDTNRRCDALQEALAVVVDDRRFVPYVQRHEFEALVLASLPALRSVLDAADDLAGLDALIVELDGVRPEDVNDGAATAPSKRLLKNVPGYRKVVHGPIVTAAAGLGALRSACPRFDAWVARLEALATAPGGSPVAPSR